MRRKNYDDQVVMFEKHKIRIETCGKLSFVYLFVGS